MTSTVGGGEGPQKADKTKGGCVILYVTRVQGVQKYEKFADVLCRELEIEEFLLSNASM